MYLTENDVRAIATYARIGLTEEEVTALAVDLNNIIESLKPITEYDLTGVEPTFHPIAGLTNVMREDMNQPGLTHDQAMGIAPASEDGQYRIPTILGDGGEA